MSKPNTLSLYACGGCGVNVVTAFTKFAGKFEHGFAQINPFFLDTSRSNLRNLDVPEDHVYVIDNVDGSGKKRDANYRVISESSKEMLHRFKPSDINIVVHSASGGSGSVISPVLVSELLARGAPTIVVMIGSSDSRIEAENTIKTLKSYEVISQKRDMPVVAVYYENSKSMPRGKVDQQVQTMIVLLAVIFSGQNRELDSADLANFLNFPKVSSHESQLAYLDFFSKDIELPRGQTPITVVTLTDDQTDSAPGAHVEYQAVGFVDEKVKAAVGVDLPVHAVVVEGFFIDTVHRLESRLKEIDDVKATRVSKSIVSGDIDSTDDGLVL